jgi:uncharacterized protein (DUF58 family)
VPYEGRAWLFVSALFVGIGVYKNINLLTLLGYVLLAIGLLNILLAWRRLRRCTGYRLLPEVVIAGEPCTIQIVVSIPGVTGVLDGVLLEEEGSSEPFAVQFLPYHGPGSRSANGSPDDDCFVARTVAVLPSRGKRRLAALNIRTGYPFGLVWRQVELLAPEEVVVLPALGDVHRGRFRRFLRGTDPRRERPRQIAIRHRAAQAEFHGLREWRTGDSPRWIHWRTSARRGTVMVREFEDPQGDDLLVLLDTRGEFAGKRFEARISLAASLCWEWCRQKDQRLVLGVVGAWPEKGADAVVLSGLTGLELARQMLTVLALVEPVSEDLHEFTANPIPPFLDSLVAATPRSAGVLLLGLEGFALADPLRRRLERPIACIEAVRDLDFYVPPGSSDHRVPGSPR